MTARHIHAKQIQYRCMIKSFSEKETEKVYNQIFSKKLPQTIQRIAFNIQYRICFNVDGDDFFNVEIVDYHS